MANLGIIAEYNPFHNGHLYQINKSKEMTKAENVIVVMSGNFTQRGLPACCDKFSRCKMALSSGVDMILELPSFYASSSAEHFAYGSVEILDKSNIIDYLSFGSENGSIEELMKFEKFLYEKKDAFNIALKKHLKTGNSYPSSQYKALQELGQLDYKSTSNNILAIEYLKALKKLNSKIKPITIKRHGTDYHQLDKWETIASASAIRNSYYNDNSLEFKDTMPKDSYDIFIESMNNYNFDYNNLTIVFNYIFSIKTKSEILQIVDMNEELYNRIKNARKECHSLKDIIDSVKSKNYTQTRIQRVILNIILNNTLGEFKEILKNGQPYIRIIGFKREKANLVGELVNSASIPVVVNIKNANKVLDKNSMNIFQKELAKTDIFNLTCTNFHHKSCDENQIIIL